MPLRWLVTCIFGYLYLCVFSPAAYAQCQTVTFSRQGAWEAYGGPCNSGSKMCGISTNGKYAFFGMKYFKGNSYLTVQLINTRWRIRDGSKYKVTMEIDDSGAWATIGTGIHSGDGMAGLEFEIPRSSLGQFLAEFMHGEEMAVRFPGSDDISNWTLSLNGSHAIVGHFANCIEVMQSAK